MAYKNESSQSGKRNAPSLSGEGVIRHAAARRSHPATHVPVPGMPASTSRSREEAQALIGRMLARLFFQEAGALYLLHPSRKALELAAVWGTHDVEEQSLAQKTAQGLLEDRIHLGDKAFIPMQAPSNLRSKNQTCLCVPMHSSRGLLGLLYARFKSDSSSVNVPLYVRTTEQKQRFAVSAAEALALALADATAMK